MSEMTAPIANSSLTKVLRIEVQKITVSYANVNTVHDGFCGGMEDTDEVVTTEILQTVPEAFDLGGNSVKFEKDVGEVPRLQSSFKELLYIYSLSL